MNGVRMRACVVLAALELWGCGGGDEPKASAPTIYPVIGCEWVDPKPCDIQTTACQNKLLTLAACMRGSEPGLLPPITHLTVADYTAQLQAEAAMAVPDPATPHLDAALALLGAAQPGDLSDEAGIARAAAGVLAFYRDDSDDIVIIDRDDVDRNDANATLLHEFVHALQDRESDLTAYRNAHLTDGTFDEFLATDAMVEGEARFHEYIYAISLLGHDPRKIDFKKFFQAIVEQDESYFLDEASPATAAPFVFPYDWGARFVNLGWTGHQSIVDLLANPPLTTRTIVNSIDRVTRDGFMPSEITAPTPPDAWTALGEERLGAFGTYLLVQKLLGNDQAKSLAVMWRGDSLVVYGGSEASGDTSTTAFLWSCDLADAGSATAIGNALSGALAGVEVQVNDKRVTVAAANDGSDIAWAFAEPAP
jgi:hypothetical protein